jgi:3-oxoadipate enol-lactonase
MNSHTAHPGPRDRLVEPAFLAVRGGHLADRFGHSVGRQVSTVDAEVTPRKFHMLPMTEAVTATQNLVQNCLVCLIHGFERNARNRVPCLTIRPEPVGHRPAVGHAAGQTGTSTIPCVEAIVPVPDGELWAEDTGGDGPAVVLIHGDWTDAGVWASLVPLLQGPYRVIRYDLRGFGRSSRPSRPFTRLGDLRAVLDHFGIRKAVAVGHSGGGGTALGLALHCPERTEAITLIAPGIHDYPWPDDDPYVQECGSLIAAADHDSLVSLGLRTWASSGAGAAIAAMVRGAVSSWFQIGDLERTDPPGFRLLNAVRIPAVMLLGEQEYPMVADVSRTIAARLSGCRTILVPGADHLLPLREPALLANAIADVTG